jgi:hypothetical protein
MNVLSEVGDRLATWVPAPFVFKKAPITMSFTSFIFGHFIRTSCTPGRAWQGPEAVHLFHNVMTSDLLPAQAVSNTNWGSVQVRYKILLLILHKPSKG